MSAPSRTPANAPRVVLGLSADYHDAAAAVLVDGRLVVAAEEERFSRVKHDPAMPAQATRWCLDAAGIGPGDLDAVAFYAKPLTTYERVLASHARAGPRAFPALARAVRVWSGSKLWLPLRIERLLAGLGHPSPRLHYAEHHQSHAASAFYPSPFERAVVITCDGVGEWTTSSIGHGIGNRLELLREQAYPDSLGLFFSAMTAHCGFNVNDGEYKLMGLAPYGVPRYVEALRRNAIAIHADGSVQLDQRAFRYQGGRRMGGRRLDRILDGPPLDRGMEPTQREADIACSTQVILEDAVLAMARHAHTLTGERYACLAGGVALNCVANGRLRREGPFDDIWVQPAAGDSGGAPGAAWWLWHEVWDQPRSVEPVGDGMHGAALGPAFTGAEVSAHLTRQGVRHRVVTDPGTLDEEVAGLLAAGQVVGWFEGAMEFGPRALGRRSILADPRDPAMVARINELVKSREGFRPFAPAVLAQHAGDWFDLEGDAPYMLVTAPVTGPPTHADGTTATAAVPTTFAARLAEVRSAIPACTHVDGSARVQTVDQAQAPRFHALLEAFHRTTGCPVLLNTSFNGGGEPIVCTPADALATFAATGLDVLVVEGCIVTRDDLPGRIAA
jgi:carbamoyltransferase